MIRLPRMQATTPIAGEAPPTSAFQRWWQTVVESIEQAFADVQVAQQTADTATEWAEMAHALAPRASQHQAPASVGPEPGMDELRAELRRLRKRIENLELQQ